VATIAKALPIRRIPEQIVIAPVRLDMVNARSRHDATILLTLCTQWILLPEMLTRSRPPIAVATLGRFLAMAVALRRQSA